jgi:hypothetical protein
MLKSDFTMAYARWTEVNRTINLRVEIKICGYSLNVGSVVLKFHVAYCRLNTQLR